MHKILIYETDRDILDLMTLVLEMEGFITYPLMDCSKDFLSIIHNVRPNVVVLDFRISGVDCINALKDIRQNYPDLPVIAISCNNNIGEIYLRHGFDDYIEKPFDIDLLYETLRRHVNVSADSKV